VVIKLRSNLFNRSSAFGSKKGLFQLLAGCAQLLQGGHLLERIRLLKAGPEATQMISML
jgi:hypothetical protein